MTICAAVKARDGLALGTDSMTQIWGRDPSGRAGAIKTYSNARKLFQVGELSIGVMTWGIGNLGARSVESLLRECGSILPEEHDVKSIGEALHEFFSSAYSEHFGDASEAIMGFYIAGYSPDAPLAEEWEFNLPRDEEIREVRPADAFGASWRGIALPFTRLYFGRDPRMLADLREKGVPEEVINEVSNRYKTPVSYDGMPVQDAINFVKFILETTIGLAAFEVGPAPLCGGPLRIAAVLPHEGFNWIKQPQLTAD